MWYLFSCVLCIRAQTHTHTHTLGCVCSQSGLLCMCASIITCAHGSFTNYSGFIVHARSNAHKRIQLMSIRSFHPVCVCVYVCVETYDCMCEGAEASLVSLSSVGMREAIDLGYPRHLLQSLYRWVNTSAQMFAKM